MISRPGVAVLASMRGRGRRRGDDQTLALAPQPLRPCAVVAQELQLPYAIEALPMISATRPFTQPTGTGKVPTIADGSLVMFESIAIMEYLLERYGDGRLAPDRGAPERGPFLQWLHYSESTAFPPLGYIARHSFALPEAERIPPRRQRTACSQPTCSRCPSGS